MTELDEIFDKYTKIVWLNPTTSKPYIPAENIPLLKEELLKLFNRKGRK